MNRPAAVTMREDGYVQDLGSQWVAEAVGAGPGQRVLDVCAAPGGKATYLAGQGARVVAADARPSRVGLVSRNAQSLELGPDRLVVVAADGTAPPFRRGSFDKVLLDAPCSGLGALRRRPDARWRIEPDDVDHLAELQRRLLDRRLRPGPPGRRDRLQRVHGDRGRDRGHRRVGDLGAARRGGAGAARANPGCRVVAAPCCSPRRRAPTACTCSGSGCPSPV